MVEVVARANVFKRLMWSLQKWRIGNRYSKVVRRMIPSRPYLMSGVEDAGVRSSDITPAWPYLTTRQSGVRPRLSGVSGLASSCPSSSFTTPSCPPPAAYQSGVSPYLFGLSGSTSSCPSSIFTTPLCPLKLAHTRGVLPAYSVWLISQLSTSTKPATISTIPKKDAQCRQLGRRVLPKSTPMKRDSLSHKRICADM